MTISAREAHERAKLERAYRRMARGPIVQEQLSLDGDGLLMLELNRAFTDGTTHLLFEPEDFSRSCASCTSSPDSRRWFRHREPI